MSFPKKDSSKVDLSSVGSSSSYPMTPQGSSSISTTNSVSNGTMRRQNAAPNHNGNKGKGAKSNARQRNPDGYSKRKNKPRQGNNKTVLSNDDFEHMLKTSGKKGVDISHLLDFRLPEHERAEPSQFERKRMNKYKSRSSVNLNLTGRNYVNVNYRFIVDPKCDYKPQFLDANVPLEDSSIVRVIVNKNDHQCPICLDDDFVAPRMTKCGHIFCYPCLMRLFSSLEETDPRRRKTKCPLCSENIWEKHPLLSVLINNINENEQKPKVGDTVDLQLMYRPANKILAQPLYMYIQNIQFPNNIPWISDKADPKNFLVESPYAKYSRLMKCHTDFILQCFEAEKDSIHDHKIMDKELYGDSGAHYDLALSKIQQQIDVVHSEII
ncbi:unnamed protein product [Ambrosiozyma monospora]|uniref:Unnamed protein product n=1 Tax=Ambrosiozyma monospora TaxID=43982 RepID=A0ACB5SWP5_AMBMO|nr:unnamed protein product [Ambrosiozyma monospora]